MNKISNILKEPLIHFVVIGMGIFMLYEAVAPEDAGLSDKVIVVNRESLLTHMQFRTRSFEPDVAEQRFDALSEEELERTIKEFVREEALHREAKAMGMEANDYVIKRRLIQKVEFLAQGFADASVDIQQDELETFLDKNKDDYFIEPHVTFTHVFFSADKRGIAGALSAAQTTLTELNNNQVPFVDAGKYGDRFYYNTNYVEQSADLIVSHFGPDIANTVFSTPAGDSQWHGPVQSEYGSHLILIVKSEPGRYPSLSEVKPLLLDDMRRIQSRQKLDAAIDEIVSAYEVRTNLSIANNRTAAAPENTSAGAP